jgi:cobalt-zinc-cadmium efflux system protein
VGGLFSGSLALLSDAIHNGGDAISTLLAYIAFRLSKKEIDERKTYGYKRLEILAALFNSVLLIVIILFLFYEAYDRFYHPQKVQTLIMMIVAFIGAIANALSVFLLKTDADKNINVKSTYIHQLGDALSSFAVVIGGALIYFFHIYWIDPLLTIVIGLYILKETYPLLLQSLQILMQGAPSSVKVTDVINEIKSFPQVKDIHLIHLWALNDKENHFDCHVQIDKAISIQDSDYLRDEIISRLQTKFEIHNSVIQMEGNCIRN